mgnify:CR=1 FL=1
MNTKIDIDAIAGERWFPKESSIIEDMPSLWGDWGVASEVDDLKAVLMRRPGKEIENFDWEAARFKAPIDPQRFRAQHDALAQVYRDHGVTVHYIEEQREDRPNALFCRDLVLMTPEGAIVTRPAMEARRGEERYAAKALADLGVPIIRTICGSATFEGAMVMWVDRHTAILACGVRTNREGFEMVEHELKRMGVTEVVPMQVPYGHAHIDGNLNLASHDVALIHASQVPYDVCDVLKRKGYKLLECPSQTEAKQSFAINFVAIKPGLIAMPAGNPRSQELLEKNGITVIPVDLSEILAAAHKIEDTDEVLQAKLKEIRQYAVVPEQYSDKLVLQAKFGVAVEKWMEANEIDAVAIQCWDSLEQNYGCAACVTMSMLSEKLIPAACEVDIAGAVSMYALTLASGRPSALLDWNNNFAEDRNKCVCTHCGNFPKSFVMNDLKLGTLGVLGRTLGKVHTFGAVYGKVKQGDFTFFRISTDDTKGCIKSYLGKGDLTDDPYGMDGCIAVTKVDNLQPLMKYICKNGFEHHVAMCRGNVKDILAEAIETYLNWNIYIHE